VERLVSGSLGTNELAAVETRAGEDVILAPERRSIWRDSAEIVLEFWQYRGLLYQLTLRDIRIRYKQAVMGFGWAIFMPMLIVLSGIIVRYAMAYLSGSDLQTGALVGVAVKAIPWAFFVGAIGFASASLIGNANLVTKIYFPREVVPLSAVLAQTFDSSVGAVALLLVLPLLGVSPSLGFLWVPPLALLLFFFTAGAALLLSCANLFFRDVKYIVQVLLTFGIFFTPVFFEPAMFGAVGAKLMMLNPLAPILEGIRLALVEGHNLLRPLVIVPDSGAHILAWSPWYLLYSAAWAVLGFVASSLLFHRLEFLFAEYV
jgi:ABC-type polysaccharide/polyol phosphate export permease